MFVLNGIAVKPGKAIFPWIIILSAALFIALAPLQIYTPWMIMSLCLVSGLLGISLLQQEEDRRFLYKLFVGGYLLRISTAIFLHLMTYSRPRLPGFFIDDGWVYSANGARIAERLQHGLPVIGVPRAELWSYSGGIHFYDYINGGIYFFLGSNPLIMFFLNSFFGILAALFIYFVALSVSNRNAARTAAALCAFWPSLFLWSTQNLKEPLTIVCIVLCLWGFVFFLKKFNACYLVITFLSLRFLGIFRPPFDRLVLASLVLHAVFLGLYLIRKRPFLLFPAIIFLVLASAGSGRAFGEYFETLKDLKPAIATHVQTIDNLRSPRATAELAFLPDYRISGLGSLVRYLPIGTLLILFAPFPWQLFSASQIMALPEMLVWYAMFPCLVKGVRFCAREGQVYLFSILSYSVLTILLLACIEGNVGTMFRHRSVVLIFLLMFVAIGIDIRAKEKV